MDRARLLQALVETAEDRHLSRSERRGLRAVVEAEPLEDEDRWALQRALVEHVAGAMTRPEDRALVHWLGDALALLAPQAERRFPASRAWFGPEDPMVETVQGIIGASRRTLDVAVFTITDDRLAEAVHDAARRGVRVRIITDDDKAHDRGSDVFDLRAAGIPVAPDRSPFHFHHKFCLVDERVLLTGSYNWTRGADRDNRENFLVTQEPALVSRYQAAFEQLWLQLAG